MEFIKISSKEMCQVCGENPAAYTNDSAILFCSACKEEAEILKRNRKKPGQSITFRIPADLILKLRQLSSETGRSLNYLATIALKKLIKEWR